MKNIKESFLLLSRISVYIIIFLYILIISMIGAALLIILCNEKLFADFDTALFWTQEIVLSVRQILFIGAIGVFIIEMIYRS